MKPPASSDFVTCRITAVFELDENSTSRIRLDPIPERLTGQALAGVRACPVAALSAHALD